VTASAISPFLGTYQKPKNGQLFRTVGVGRMVLPAQIFPTSGKLKLERGGASALRAWEIPTRWKHGGRLISDKTYSCRPRDKLSISSRRSIGDLCRNMVFATARPTMKTLLVTVMLRGDALITKVYNGTGGGKATSTYIPAPKPALI
jgi:hypothetical protein